MIDTNRLISMTEANQNFSKVARTVDKFGTAVILKNNIPKYIVMEYAHAEKNLTLSAEKAREMAKEFCRKNEEAMRVLAE